MITLTPDAQFQVANPAALLGWLWLLLWLFLPENARQRTRLGGLMMPLLLSILYTANVLVFFADSPGGFDTLKNVMALFTNEGMVLAGWIHYLAFDLFTGWCIAHNAIDQRINRILVIPCLLLTFVFGPVGLLVYATIRLAYWFSGTRTVAA